MTQTAALLRKPQSAADAAEPSLPGSAATPLMAQYLAIKREHPDCLLFFRLGDFYELFFEDAIKAARALDITLTRRGQVDGRDVPMCGVPFHAYETYLARLIRQGFHVAICEQTEDPAEAKKRGGKSIVTREVVRIVTPGTVTEDTLLDARSANILACLVHDGRDGAVAWIDLAAGQPFVEPCETPHHAAACLARLNPSEILLSDRTLEDPALFEMLAQWREKLTLQNAARMNGANARKRLSELYGVQDMESFGDFSQSSLTAMGTILDYVSLTQKCDISHILPPRLINHAPVMAMDASTRRNLELTHTLGGERHGALLATIDRTLTNAGARLLAARLCAPITDVNALAHRHDAVAFGVDRPALRQTIRTELSHTPDLERALARLMLGRGGPRDLAAVRDSMKNAAALRSVLLAVPTNEIPNDLAKARQDLGEYSALHDKLARALAADLPLLARDGGFIAPGYCPQLDELVALRDDGRRLMVGLQQTYASAAGVSNLKIKHNQVIGYYIEVPPTQAEKLFAQKELFIHRQTLAGAVRFTTIELSEAERKISEAAGKALAVEAHLFADLVKDIEVQYKNLRQTAEALATLDVTMALSELAATEDYTRPQIDESLAFSVTGGRHPVVEHALKTNGLSQSFVGNDCDLGEARRLWLLTGPNMAGKSTFLRQNALIALLAQMGSFVPAKNAHIGVISRLFSRVGAADDLARGQSTFMVEMVETAAILNQADERSLVILDEIGRGTATYDGLSIAWATIEHLHEVNRCRTLFATHYHELTELAARLPNLACMTMAIKEWEKEIIFLHKVIKGTADRSYGIHVAQMAGLPRTVISRAETILAGLESGKSAKKPADLVQNLPLFAVSVAQNTQKKPDSPVLDAIRDLNPDDLTPKQALEALYKLKGLMG